MLLSQCVALAVLIAKSGRRPGISLHRTSFRWYGGNTGLLPAELLVQITSFRLLEVAVSSSPRCSCSAVLSCLSYTFSVLQQCSKAVGGFNSDVGGHR